MKDVISWAALAASLILVSWVLIADHRASMKQCERTMSRDTCVYALR